MKHVTIKLENKPGQLADICEALGKEGINIETIVGSGHNGAGLVQIVTGDPITAEKALKRAGYNAVSDDVILVKIADKPGELGKITRKLAFRQVNIEALYMLRKGKGETEFAFKVDNPINAEAALKL